MDLRLKSLTWSSDREKERERKKREKRSKGSSLGWVEGWGWEAWGATRDKERGREKVKGGKRRQQSAAREAERSRASEQLGREIKTVAGSLLASPPPPPPQLLPSPPPLHQPPTHPPARALRVLLVMCSGSGECERGKKNNSTASALSSRSGSGGAWRG